MEIASIFTATDQAPHTAAGADERRNATVRYPGIVGAARG
jgi:hypothetical protein